jgi:hypothetical protein
MRHRYSVLSRISLIRRPRLAACRLDNTSYVCRGSEHSPWLQSIFYELDRIPRGLLEVQWTHHKQLTGNL